MSFGELLVVAVLGLVVLGPKELPKVLRTLGRTVAKLRRMSRDLRQQSGIDEIIRAEGLEEELATLRSLRGMSPSGLVDSFIENSSQRTKKLAVLAAARHRCRTNLTVQTRHQHPSCRRSNSRGLRPSQRTSTRKSAAMLTGRWPSCCLPPCCLRSCRLRSCCLRSWSR